MTERSNFAPALGQSAPRATDSTEYKNSSPHFEHVEALSALIGTIISQLFQAGAPFTDTLGNFRPIVISSDGITVNTSTAHPTSFIFHDTLNGTIDSLLTLFGALQPTFAPNQGSGGSAVRVLVVNDNRVLSYNRGWAWHSGSTTAGDNPRLDALESTGLRTIYKQTHIARVKAGAPVDGDYDTPTDGMIVVDSTNNKLWARHGGAWHFVLLT